MQKCVTCQFYDRRNSGPAEGKSASWGQCRRAAPMLHPVNVKSYMVEGVWPHVRDDDWCGEWKVIARRVPADGPAPARVGPTPEDAPRIRVGPTPEDAPRIRVGPTPEDAPRIRVAPTPDDAPRVLPPSPLPGPVPERAMVAAGSLMAGHGAFD